MMPRRLAALAVALISLGLSVSVIVSCHDARGRVVRPGSRDSRNVYVVRYGPGEVDTVRAERCDVQVAFGHVVYQFGPVDGSSTVTVSRPATVVMLP